jgi:DNA-directed RNA polymerase subunit H (RpoH/RPB5)
MDINRILEHTKELLELRNEDGEEFKTKVNEIDMNRFINEHITVQLKNYTILFTLNKNSFKDLWASLRNMTPEQIKQDYGNNKFILIVNEYPPSITLQSLHAKDLALHETDGFIHIFLGKELMYNPNKHSLVPKHEKMNEEEIKILMNELHIKQKTQLPFIQKTDIISRWLGLKQGDIVRITRHSETSGEYFYYRVCI